MRVSDFDFDLPEELIAKYPPENRGDSRLMVLNGANGLIRHDRFSSIVELLQSGDLLVFNNTKVVPARLFGAKETGGKLEVLFERKIDERKFLAHVRSSKSPKPNSCITLLNTNTEESVKATMLARHGALFELELAEGREVFEVLEAFGHIPLPPYIDRQDEGLDKSRYQTVYAKEPGAAAAPTAGLHFSEELISELKEKGVGTAQVTLHVGAGTFQPVKVDNVFDHEMHSEWIDVPQSVVDLVKETKERGGRVVAVGTTSLRSLESASQRGQLERMQGDTDIFIYPGYQFKTVDALITNFHLPKSTLLMLVSALVGKDNILKAYQEAVQNKYRFFSYGDAMFLHNSDNVNQ